MQVWYGKRLLPVFFRHLFTVLRELRTIHAYIKQRALRPGSVSEPTQTVLKSPI